MTVFLCSQILGFIAKGSYGPIMKVKDILDEKTYAVKVGSTIVTRAMTVLYNQLKICFT